MSLRIVLVDGVMEPPVLHGAFNTDERVVFRVPCSPRRLPHLHGAWRGEHGAWRGEHGALPKLESPRAKKPSQRTHSEN